MVCLESPNICQVKCQIVLDLKVKPSRSSYLALPGSPILTLNMDVDCDFISNGEIFNA